MQAELTQVCGRGEAESLLKDDSSWDLILLDLTLPDSPANETLREFLPRVASRPVVLLTAQDDEELALEAIQQGAQDFLVKGQFNRIRLEQAILYALERQRILKERDDLRQALEWSHHLRDERMEALEQELELASTIQRSLMPKSFVCKPGLEIGFLFLPCAQVSGDLFDVIELSNQRTAFFIIDGVGHGVPAALMTTVAKLSIGRLLQSSPSLEDAMPRINAELASVLKKGRYITAFCGIFDPANRSFHYCQAGHPPACLIDAGGQVDWLESGAPPFGLFADEAFPVGMRTLRPGDRLHLYTDGISELQNDKGKRLGKSGLAELFHRTRGRCQDYALNLLDQLQAFQGLTAREDDLTLLFFRVE